jgi:hypothetical protein
MEEGGRLTVGSAASGAARCTGQVSRRSGNRCARDELDRPAQPRVHRRDDLPAFLQPSQIGECLDLAWVDRNRPSSLLLA